MCFRDVKVSNIEIGRGRKKGIFRACTQVYTREWFVEKYLLCSYFSQYSIFTQCLNLYLSNKNGWERDRQSDRGDGRVKEGTCGGRRKGGKERQKKNDIIVSKN